MSVTQRRVAIGETGALRTALGEGGAPVGAQHAAADGAWPWSRPLGAGSFFDWAVARAASLPLSSLIGRRRS